MRALLLSCLMFTACGPVLFVDAQANSVCQHVNSKRFFTPLLLTGPQPALIALSTTQIHVSRTFDFDVTVELPKQLQSADIVVNLSTVNVTLPAETDMTFLKGATVTLVPPDGSSLPSHPLSDLHRTEAQPNVLQFTGDEFDVAPYVLSGLLRYEVGFDGTLPRQEISAEVDACASASLHFNYASGE